MIAEVQDIKIEFILIIATLPLHCIVRCNVLSDELRCFTMQQYIALFNHIINMTGNINKDTNSKQNTISIHLNAFSNVIRCQLWAMTRQAGGC